MSDETTPEPAATPETATASNNVTPVQVINLEDVREDYRLWLDYGQLIQQQSIVDDLIYAAMNPLTVDSGNYLSCLRGLAQLLNELCRQYALRHPVRQSTLAADALLAAAVRANLSPEALRERVAGVITALPADNLTTLVDTLTTQLGETFASRVLDQLSARPNA